MHRSSDPTTAGRRAVRQGRGARRRWWWCL